MNNHKFTVQLRPGLTVSATIDVGKLKRGKGKIQYLLVEWSGKPTRADIPLYRDWMLTVQQECSQLLGGKIVWCLPLPDRIETYVLQPGAQPERIT